MKTKLIICILGCSVLVGTSLGLWRCRSADKHGLGDLTASDVETDAAKLDQVWERFRVAWQYQDARAVRELLEPTVRETTPISMIETVFKGVRKERADEPVIEMRKDSVKIDRVRATFYVKTIQSQNPSVLNTYQDVFAFVRVDDTWYLWIDFKDFAKIKGFIK